MTQSRITLSPDGNLVLRKQRCHRERSYSRGISLSLRVDGQKPLNLFNIGQTRTPSLNDIPSGSSFVYSDRVIAYSDDYWFRTKSSKQMPSAAGCSTKVSGDTYAQRLSGSEGDGAYSNEVLSHTDLPTSGAYIPSSRPPVL